MDEIPYSDFINRELILFSMADNIRSIPSVADGLKPGQRKVVWGCFKRKLKKEIKVQTNQIAQRSITESLQLGRTASWLYLRTCCIPSRRAELDDDNR